MSLIDKFDNKVIIPFVILIGIGLFAMYWRTGGGGVPGDYELKTGNYRLEDGLHDEAEELFMKALTKNPDHVDAHLSLGITYMQTGRNDKALSEFNRTIELKSDHALAYADRGILYDRMGEYEKALSDYRKSMEIDDVVTEGPGWLWRFMRNIDEKPPTVKERADYIESEMKKSPEDRSLKFKVEDDKQRMHKKSF